MADGRRAVPMILQPRWRLCPDWFLHMMDDLISSEQVLEAVLYVSVTLFTVVYTVIFYFLQRREHHVRTGSLKDTTSQPFTSPHPGRKVTRLQLSEIQIVDYYFLEHLFFYNIHKQESEIWNTHKSSEILQIVYTYICE